MACSVSERVKVYTGIASAASEDREGREAALWFVLRHLDGDGRGWVPLADLRQFCAEAGFVSDRHLRRVLARGDGSWWTLNSCSGRCEYRSLARVCLRLRTTPGVSLAVPVSKLRGRGVAALGLAGFLAARDGRPVKVATVAQVTGIGARSQQRYRAHLGIERQQNVGCEGRYNLGEMVEGARWFYQGKVYRWLPCSWAVPFGVLSDSHSKKVTKAVRGAVGIKGDGDWARLFWTDFEKARKARRKGPLSWVRRDRQFGATVVWDAI